jgi:hypothetical protein
LCDPSNELMVIAVPVSRAMLTPSTFQKRTEVVNYVQQRAAIEAGAAVRERLPVDWKAWKNRDRSKPDNVVEFGFTGREFGEVAPEPLASELRGDKRA